ncbi:orotate phosphoribosyltransferase, partial [Lactobacillus delbrueckii subsp. bulgaricus]|nr:orotate phosphoribosyltransferase [Lactobacillus delbrueckii subsp. bulgaricus]
MQNNEIIRQLIDKKIVTISPDKDFVYASGMHSP